MSPMYGIPGEWGLITDQMSILIFILKFLKKPILISRFGTGWGDLNTMKDIQFMISLAKEHNKPLMIAESAAIKTYGGPDDSWVIPNTSWFVNLFNLFKSHPETVKAFTYINADWNADNPQSTWGDTRIQTAAPEVQEFWDENLGRLTHASDTLFNHIGYYR